LIMITAVLTALVLNYFATNSVLLRKNLSRLITKIEESTLA